MTAQSWTTVVNWTTNAGLSGAANGGAGSSAALLDISATPQFQFQANQLQERSIIELIAEGTLSATGTPTILIGFYWGGIAGISLANNVAIATGTNPAAWRWRLEYEGVVRTAGPTGTIIGGGTLLLGTSLTVFSVIPISGIAQATVTIDTTVAKSLTVGAQWGTANAANLITCNKFLIKSSA